MARTSSLRCGVTLLEVLFAVLIGTIGLLGAIALLPVASEQARKGRQADATAIAGESFVNEFIARRLFDPDNWIGYDGSMFIRHDHLRPKLPIIPTPKPWGAFVLPTPAPANITKPGDMNESSSPPTVGQSFCIDPRGFTLYVGSGSNLNYRWFPFAGVAAPAMHRMGLPTSAFHSMTPASQSFTDLICTSADDIITDRTDRDRALPARQSYNPNAPTSYDKLTRESEGRISWIATLCPRLGGATDEYVLSMVTFYNRPLPVAGPDNSAEREVLVQSFGGGGITGGDVVLYSPVQSNLDLRRGEWVMLKSASPERFQWYRVIDTEIEPQVDGAGFSREVTLFGQDWPSDLAATPPAAQTQAVLLTGVTAVYERTVRIQRSSLWP